MKIKMWLRSKKFDAKQWLKNHRAHILATFSTLALCAMLVWFGSQQLANFIDREFITPASASQNLTK